MSNKVDFRVIAMVEEFLTKYSEYRGIVRKIDGYGGRYRHFQYNDLLVVVERSDVDYDSYDDVNNDSYYAEYQTSIELVSPRYDLVHWLQVESFRPYRNPNIDKDTSDDVKRYHGLVTSVEKLTKEVTGLKTALKMVEKYSSHLTMKWRGGYLTSINDTPIKEWIAEMLILGEEV